MDDGIDVSAAVKGFDAAPFMRLQNAAELLPGKGDHRLGAADELAVHVDQDRLVARVRNEIMGAQGCGHGWLLLEQAVGCSAELRCAFAAGSLLRLLVPYQQNPVGQAALGLFGPVYCGTQTLQFAGGLLRVWKREARVVHGGRYPHIVAQADGADR